MEPVKKFTGKIIAIVYRKDDIEEKWVDCARRSNIFQRKEIRRQIQFSGTIFRQ